MKRRLMTMGCLGALAVAFASPAVTPAAAQGKKMVIAAPGIPPIFAAVHLYVAEKEGFFKKYGVDAEIRAFDTGTAAARAVISGDIEMALSPSALIINQISNANANLVVVYGITNSDFVLATTDPTKTSCKDVVGQAVGVDTVGGARSIALRSMLLGGCPDVKIEDVQQVGLSSNASSAMIAGRLSFGVLHFDDIATIELQGKKVTTLLALQKTNPNNHYLSYVVRIDKLKENRDAYVRLMAALIDAARFIRDPKNADRVADIAAPTGLHKLVAKATIKPLLDIDYWPADNSGIDRKRLEGLTAIMKKTGGITADKEPVKFERLVDESVWRDANAMVK
jgi:ABC-type nitrate/sulfonate/bicarbonate transport system substrate-binding protein